VRDWTYSSCVPCRRFVDQPETEQESLAIQLCEETVRGAVAGTVARPRRTANVVAELPRIRPVLDLPPILPPAEPPPTYRLSSAEVVASSERFAWRVGFARYCVVRRSDTVQAI
jgi:hypothetical protein